MTAAEFIETWTGVTLTERSSAHQHFLGLCDLLGHQWPVQKDKTGVEFTFEKGAKKPDGSDGWADVWKRGFFGWEYKKPNSKSSTFTKAYDQLLRYKDNLENPPLLVVSDTDRIVVHTNFTNTPHREYVVELAELDAPESRKILRAVFEDPNALKPTETRQRITEAVAEQIAELAKLLRKRNNPPQLVARFLDRIVFCMFAEDVELLPKGLFTLLSHKYSREPKTFAELTRELFRKMDSGGHFGLDRIRHFNGSLFSEDWVPELTTKDVEAIASAAVLDWSAVDPSILGTLFERGLDPDVRAQLGAHYTGYDDIVTLVEPVVMRPHRQEWHAVRDRSLKLIDKGTKKGRKDAAELVDSFLQRLTTIRILDPACGSGNFLYVALQRLKDLEKEANDWAVARDLGILRHGEVGPWQLYGLELNQYAHELARMTVWIGYLQWRRENGYGDFSEPILRATDNFQNIDALFTVGSNGAVVETQWPEADYVIGNPPFLGSRNIRDEISDDYAEKLYRLFRKRIPNSSDLCCYFFQKALEELERRPSMRVGLLATQGIRGQANRRVLEKIDELGGIFFAISDRDWVLDGANVHVSLIGFDDGSDIDRDLDGLKVDRIFPDLTATHNTTKARRLADNQNLSFYADVKSGKFDLKAEELVLQILHEPNPNGRPSSDVLLPYINTKHVVQRSPFTWVIDFDGMDLEHARLYEAPFQHVLTNVKSKRDENKRPRYRDFWWLHAEPCDEMRTRIWSLPRFLVTPSTGKHRVFAWQTTPTLPDHAVVAFAISDDYLFGVLQSRVHTAWALRVGTQLRERESGFRYTPTTCFETFPFPAPSDLQREAIAIAAAELEAKRQEWLNPSQYVRPRETRFPASVNGRWGHLVQNPDDSGIGEAVFVRLEPINEAASALVRERTMTNLYNRMPPWLRALHDTLDLAVSEAYGFPLGISDIEVVGKLLELNLKQSPVSE